MSHGRDLRPATDARAKQTQEGNQVQGRVEGVGQSQAQSHDLITDPLAHAKATAHRVDARAEPLA